MTTAAPRTLTNTGIRGLDFVLGGGLPAENLYLLEGTPGTGKTTLALQFLLAGVAAGEPVLYITLAETASELKVVAKSHGWDINGIEVLELVPPAEQLEPDAQYTVFHPAEVELGQTMGRIHEAVERLRPRRVVLDSLSEMRLVADEPLRLRRQVLALKYFFVGRQCTVVLLDDVRSQESDLQFASIAHGVIALEQLALEYGAERRRLRVLKLRGQRYRGGYHDFTIRTGGLDVFPRLIAAEYPLAEVLAPLRCGNDELDLLTGGGLDRGSSTLFVGPAGVGKSVLAAQYALSAALHGEHVMVYLFDERVRTYLARAEGLGMDVKTAMRNGRLEISQIDPADMSPGQFAHMVVDAVERTGTTLIVMDSLSGYMNAMPGEQLLEIHLHELFSYLTQRGVTALIPLAQHGPFAHGSSQGAEISYLADAIILLRYFEAAGAVRQAISVLKKRSGGHERTIREYRIGPGGYELGEPLRSFRGVLTGVPEYLGLQAPLLGGSLGGTHAQTRGDGIV